MHSDAACVEVTSISPQAKVAYNARDAQRKKQRLR